jgi:alcohol dehydrogenase class IV
MNEREREVKEDTTAKNNLRSPILYSDNLPIPSLPSPPPCPPSRYADLAPLIIPSLDTSDGASDSTISDRLADALHGLALDLELETRLTEVGIQASDLELLTTGAMKQERLLPNNMREVRYEDAAAIYTAAM